MIHHKVDRPRYLVTAVDSVTCDGCGKQGTYSDIYNHERLGDYNHAKWKTLENPDYPNIKEMYDHACCDICVETILFNRF